MTEKDPLPPQPASPKKIEVFQGQPWQPISENPTIPEDKRLSNEETEKTEIKYEATLKELESILGISDKTIKEKAQHDFIQKKLTTLLKELPEKQKDLSLINSRAEGAFIHPETVIKRNFIFDGFKVNDPAIYDTLFQSLEKFYQGWTEPDGTKPNLRKILYPAIIYALGEYFGNYYTAEDTESKNQTYYSDHSGAGSADINLAELKGQSIAVCAEKAAVAHNYLKFLNINSTFIMSDNCKIDDSANGHAYTIIDTKNGKFIFDPTSPVVVSDSEGKIIHLTPAIYKISEEDYAHLINRDGKQVSIKHQNQKIKDGIITNQEPQTRIYG